MSSLRFGILLTAVLVAAAGTLGTTELVAAVASAIPAPDYDHCGEEHPGDESPCSGDSDDCRCACCPLPVLGGEGVPIELASPTLVAGPATVPSHASRVGSPPEHPPK